MPPVPRNIFFNYNYNYNKNQNFKSTKTCAGYTFKRPVLIKRDKKTLMMTKPLHVDTNIKFKLSRITNTMLKGFMNLLSCRNT
jgi:hypothetical protein